MKLVTSGAPPPVQGLAESVDSTITFNLVSFPHDASRRRGAHPQRLYAVSTFSIAERARWRPVRHSCTAPPLARSSRAHPLRPGLINDDRMITGERGQWEYIRKSEEELKGFGRKRKAVKAYYERQSEWAHVDPGELTDQPSSRASPRPQTDNPSFLPCPPVAFHRIDDILNAYEEVDTLLSSSFAKDVLHTFSKHPHPPNGAGGREGRGRYGALESRVGTPSLRSLSRDRGGRRGSGEEEALLGGGGHKEQASRSKERRETIMLNG